MFLTTTIDTHLWRRRERINRKLLGRCRYREIVKKLTWKNTSGIGGFLKSSLLDRITYWLFCVPRHGPNLKNKGGHFVPPPIPHIPHIPPHPFCLFRWTTKRRTKCFLLGKSASFIMQLQALW